MTGNINYEFVARVAHQVNKAYCQSIGDTSQVDFDDAPEWQKQSAIDGVQYHLMNANCTPEQSHEEWVRVKIKNGWVYGVKKDDVKKEHPCLVPYEQLPINQRTKDYLFKAVVDCFSSALKK